MARYFFNVRHKNGPSGLAADPDGDEIADAGQVRDHALMMARDLIARTRLDSIASWLDCTFEITDQAGQLVMMVPFTEVVTDYDGD